MLTYFGKSDIGKKRGTNQDAFQITELPCSALLAVVCDGMGGAHGGSEASSLAITVFTDYIRETLQDMDREDAPPVTGADLVRILSGGASAANAAVFEKASSDKALSGMGTTLAAVLFHENSAYIANVGDSRVYLSGKERIEQITHDHSYVQYLVDIGMITRDEARNAPNRNIITRAIGIEKTVEADITTVAIPCAGEAIVLLCSDGLCGPLDEDEIHRLLSAPEPLEELAEKLIAAANEKSGSDNITAVLIRT